MRLSIPLSFSSLDDGGAKVCWHHEILAPWRAGHMGVLRRSLAGQPAVRSVLPVRVSGPGRAAGTRDLVGPGGFPPPWFLRPLEKCDAGLPWQYSPLASLGVWSWGRRWLSSFFKSMPGGIVSQ